MIKALYQKPRLIFGCENPLLGDAGFGTEVIRFLEFIYTLPRDTACIDAGTAVHEFLLDILFLKKKPSQIIIIDAIEIPGSSIGEIKEISIRNNQPVKLCDFSLHHFSTVNMLKTIRSHSTIDVRMLIVNSGEIASQVKPGLAPAIESAVPLMCERILDILEKPITETIQPKSDRIFIRVGRLAES
jgi:coenzyme F420 hydrogenase subunit delta